MCEMEKKYVREGDAHGGFGETERLVVELRESDAGQELDVRHLDCGRCVDFGSCCGDAREHVVRVFEEK